MTQDQIGVEGGYTSIDEPGWYYVLLTDVEFDIRVNAAAISDPANYEKLTEAIQNYFRLSVLVDGEEVRNETLADLAADAQVTIDGTTPGNNTGADHIGHLEVQPGRHAHRLHRPFVGRPAQREAGGRPGRRATASR